MPTDIRAVVGPVSEPPASAGEADTLLFALHRTRATFAWKCADLDTEALHRTFPPSEMTLAGLLKHLALVEDTKTAQWVTGRFPGPPWNAIDPASWPTWAWSSAAEDSAEELYALWAGAVERSEEAWRRALTEDGPDRPSALDFDGVRPGLRRGLAELHEEYARHLGHADLFREAIDGRVGEDPPQP